MRHGHGVRPRLRHRISKRLGLYVLCLMTGTVQAENSTPLLSSRIYHRLAHLQPDIDAGRFMDARRQIEELLPTTRDSNQYDHAVLLQLLGQVQIRLDRPELAIVAWEEAATLNGLPDGDALHLKRELAQLYVRQARYEDAIRLLEQVPELDRQARLLLAQSHLQLARYRDALGPLTELIQASEQADKSLYEALFFAQHSLGQTAAAAATLQRLIEFDPHALVYWRQLAALHHEHDNTDRALAVLESAYHQGVLDGSVNDLLTLVSLYRNEGAPYKAAVLLERQLDERQLEDRIALREQLVDLWLSASETARAIKTLEQLIARSPSPERWLRLGQLHIEQRQWTAAAEALASATKADAENLTTKQLAEAWLWLGIVYVESGRQQDALAAFRRSERFVLTRRAAQQWLRYLESIG